MTTQYEQGGYKCEIVDQGLSQSSNNNPQLWLRIRPKIFLDNTDIELPGWERTVYWTITEKTIDFITEKLDALGYTGQSFRQFDPHHGNSQSFVGQEHDFYCKHENYQGEDREKWDLSRGDFEMKPLDEAEARKLDALFGRKLKERFGGTSAAVPRQKPQGVPAEQTSRAMANSDDDEIPF